MRPRIAVLLLCWDAVVRITPVPVVLSGRLPPMSGGLVTPFSTSRQALATKAISGPKRNDWVRKRVRRVAFETAGWCSTAVRASTAPRKA